MGVAVDQLHHGLFAQHVCRSTACLAGDADRSEPRRACGRADPARSDERVADCHERAGQGRDRRGRSSGGAVGRRDPRCRGRGAHCVDPGAFGCACCRKPGTDARCCGAEDAWCDAQHADPRVFLRVSDPRTGNGDLRAFRRRGGRLVHRLAHHDAAVELPAGRGDIDARDRDRGDCRDRACRHMAGSRPKSGADPPQSLTFDTLRDYWAQEVSVAVAEIGARPGAGGLALVSGKPHIIHRHAGAPQRRLGWSMTRPDTVSLPGL
ncbi:hypothetical protein RHIZ404_190327 [Rhizobium sp. EC-SD404]|nr:hypothetical protein RHIZ404_190327 [Rhizobium sp. EC-SD404]